jgi:hypothetical protein
MCSLHGVHEMNAYGAGRVCLSSRFNYRTSGRILIKFGMIIMPLSAIPNSYFLYSYKINTNTDTKDVRTCERHQHRNYAWKQTFEKYATFVTFYFPFVKCKAANWRLHDISIQLSVSQL